MPRVKIAEKDQVDGGSFFLTPSTVDTFQSGSVLLDLALGGGWAAGRVTNLVGDTSTGKTLLATEACACFARKYPEGKIWYADAEAAFDPAYGASLGLPSDRVTMVQDKDGDVPRTVEDIFEDITKRMGELAKKGGHGLYVVDSLDSLSDRAELEREIDAGSYGANKAKKLSELFRRLNSTMTGSGLSLFVISQVRDNMNAMGFGRKTIRTGGKALDFYATQIVYLKHTKRLERTSKGVKRAVGVNINAKVDKTRLGPPFREADFPIYFGFGVEDVISAIDWLIAVKRHKEVFASEEEAKKASAAAASMPLEEWSALRKQLRKAVRKVWRDIEIDFAPRKRKYG